MAKSAYYFVFEEANKDQQDDGSAVKVVLTDCMLDIFRITAEDLVVEKSTMLSDFSYRVFAKPVTVDGESILYSFFLYGLRIIPGWRKLVLCLSTESDKLNDLVAEDIRWFCTKVNESTPYNMETLQMLLPAWFSATASFSTVVVNLFRNDCKKLIYAALSDMNVVFEDDWLQSVDVEKITLRLCCERFMDACRLSEMGLDFDPVKRDTIIFRLQCGKIELSCFNVNNDLLESLPITEFCEEWSIALNKHNDKSSLQLRTLMENYRLRVLQDLNFCNRLMKSAEADYYGFYRCYLFVSSHSNSSVLLRYLSCSQQNASAVVAVIKALSSSRP